MLMCQICNVKLGNSLVRHINKIHGVTGKEYKSMYPGSIIQICSAEQRKKISIRQKSGGSKFTLQYWINAGHSESVARELYAEFQRKNHAFRGPMQLDQTVFSVEYWINRKGFTMEQAEIHISKEQAVRSANSIKFAGKNHSDASKENISRTMIEHISKIGKEQWCRHLKCIRKSKGEIELYAAILEQYPDSKWQFQISNYFVDIFVDPIIIEFYGDYWHANPKKYVESDMLSFPGSNISAGSIWEKDAIRLSNLENLGYKCIIVWQSDWNNAKKDILTDIYAIIDETIHENKNRKS